MSKYQTTTSRGRILTKGKAPKPKRLIRRGPSKVKLAGKRILAPKPGKPRQIGKQNKVAKPSLGLSKIRKEDRTMQQLPMQCIVDRYFEPVRKTRKRRPSRAKVTENKRAVAQESTAEMDPVELKIEPELQELQPIEVEQEMQQAETEEPAMPEVSQEPTAADWQHWTDTLSEIKSDIAQLEQIQSTTSALQPTLQEIHSSVEKDQARGEVLSGSMNMLTADLQELKTQVSAANQTSLTCAQSTQYLAQSMTVLGSMSAQITAQPASTPKRNTTATLGLGLGTLLLTWSLMIYLKTGELHIALAGLIMANMAGCIVLYSGRRNSR